MEAFIHAIGIAVPQFCYAQSEIAELMVEMLNTDPETAYRIRKLYIQSTIQKRYSVLQDFGKPRQEWAFWGKDFPHKVPGMAARNAIYKVEAPRLALQAARAALDEWGRDPKSITHIISISCTGVLAPGLEFLLAQKLNLRPDITRYGINFMGCFGAFKGLSLANAIAKESLNNNILVICTELCSLHLQSGSSMETLVANALFADGAAAAIVSGQKSNLWKICSTHSMMIENSIDQMTWEAGDTGFLMRLSREVPESILSALPQFGDSILKKIPPSRCDWAIHPGGKAILEAVEKIFNLERKQTFLSWKTLEGFGNMSSSTFLFVMNLLKSKKDFQEFCCGIGFGPGLSLEGIFMEKV